MKNIVLILCILFINLFSDDRVYKIVYNDGTPPLKFLDSNGNHNGLLIDIWKLWALKNNIKVEFINTSWDKSLEMIKNGEADIHAGLYFTEDRNKFLDFSKQRLYKNHNYFFYDKTVSNIEIVDLKPYVVGIGNGYPNKFMETNYSDVQVRNYDSNEDLIEAFRNSEVKVILNSLATLKYALKEKNIDIKSIRYVENKPAFTQIYYGAVKKGNVTFLKIIDEGFKNISEHEIKDIELKWTDNLGMTLNSFTHENIKFTQEERNWLLEHPTVTYGYDTDWAPFEWKNDINVHTGIIHDIIEIISSKTGVEFKPKIIEPWSEVLKAAQNREVDMLSGTGINDEKLQYLNFTSKNIYTVPFVIVSRNDDNADYINGLYMKDKRVLGIISGHSLSSRIKTYYKNLDVVTVSNTNEGFEKLKNKEIDGFIINLVTANYYINLKEYKNLRIAVKLEDSLELKIAIRNDWPEELISILDKAISTITEEQLFDIFEKWTNVKKVEKIVDWEFILEVIGLALLIILFFIFNNRKLKQLVNEKTIELQLLIKQFDKNVIASEQDLDGNLTYVSKSLCKISGYKKEELIGKHFSIFFPEEFKKDILENVSHYMSKNEFFELPKAIEKRKDGTIYYVKAYVTPKFNNKQKIIGWSAIRENITAQVEVENLSKNLEKIVEQRTSELKIQQQRFELTVAGSGDGLWEYNLFKNENWYSPQFKEMLGYRDDEFLNVMESWQNSVHPEDLQLALDAFKEHLKYDTNFDITYRIRKKDNSYIWIRSRAKSLRDKENRVTRTSGSITDITKLIEIQEEIEQINKHTQDSIEYASLIQHALIPDNRLFSKYFEDSFIYWEPKDIVGGDIYLFEEIRNNDECLLMVIDCTGHGVPGAFVTMLVKAIERQIISNINNSNDEVSTSQILTYFNITMKKLLKQESIDSISNAGFDGGVIYYNKRENYIKYSGAENSLFYIENDELKSIKGDRHSIGYKKSDVNYEFKEYKIKINNSMKFYITTDGYIDQNGGEKGFPFGKKKFGNIIETNYKKSFEIQKDIFVDELKKYQGEIDRNDDVTLLGFKISRLNEESNLFVNWEI